MSDTSSLKQLAGFVGRSPLSVPDHPNDRARALEAIAGNLALRPRRGVGELLGAVLALSARTRRMATPRVAIDMDVFTPGGTRAVKLVLPQRG